ncbi:SpoIIAA family protein [Halpernia frigidisoli]|uniref:SpoIIAA-like n=1 Tax=Halpernia frigidisoli TaxID=1125876 RepID=A0A1I3DD09_9FLAO|nr:STAS/SEC14 domain-containing protein [Halpernia frigidisoli]SFH84614.1 SpoIIAA-like [Halpernia frigidisoli]
MIFFLKIEVESGNCFENIYNLTATKNYKTMIITIPETPDNVAAFKATGDITKQDFENCVIPQIKAKVNQFNELNCLLLLETDLENFTFEAWIQDALLGLKNLTKWNRIAIVTDNKSLRNYITVFSVFIPGEYSTYPTEDLANALFWCENGNEQN